MKYVGNIPTHTMTATPVETEHRNMLVEIPLRLIDVASDMAINAPIPIIIVKSISPTLITFVKHYSQRTYSDYCYIHEIWFSQSEYEKRYEHSESISDFR